LSQHTKEVVKDSLMATGLFLLLLTSLQVPVLNILTFWFLPLPFLILSAKQRWSTAISIAVLFELLFLNLSIPARSFLIGFALVIGIVMGYLYRQSNSTGTDVVLGGLVAGLVSSWFFLLVGQFLFHMMDHLKLAWREAQQILEMTRALPANFSIPPIETFIPVFIFFAIVPVAFLNFVVGRWWLTRAKFPGKYFPPFHSWRLPRVFFIFYSLLLVATLFLEEGKNVAVYLIFGVLWVLQIIFMIQGFSLIAFLLYHWKKSKGWMILVIAVAVFTPFIFQILGILDTGSKLRERIIQKRS
jgi:uncharacterized protein YybS (DUF2232 family)